MKYRMPTVLTPLGRTDFTGVNNKGETTHECVKFVQKVTTAPSTFFWKAGTNVLEAPVGSIPYGTAIATFVEIEGPNGQKTKIYPTENASGSKHAAIYVNHIPNQSIVVLEQYTVGVHAGKVVKKTYKEINSPIRNKNPKNYWTID